MTDIYIAYERDDGGVCILAPAPNCGLTIEEIAAKDVPAGKPYKFINASDGPKDRIFRDAWEIDMTNPDGFGIGREAWFAQKAVEAASKEEEKQAQETEQ